MDSKIEICKIIEDEEIYNIIESNGINVWGSKQEDIEKKVLSHLQSLTNDEHLETNEKHEDGEISNDSSSKDTLDLDIASCKPSVCSIPDISKYLASQAQFQSSHTNKKSSNVSDRSSASTSNVCELDSGQHNLQSSYRDKRNKKLKKTINTDCSSTNDDNNHSGSDYCPSEDYDTEDSSFDAAASTSSNFITKRKRSSCNRVEGKVKDDGLLADYVNRLQDYSDSETGCQAEEQIEDDLKVSKKVWNKLYSYQQDGVRWLWNIHKQTVGGLLGDEMGLGKTVQIIVFLSALEYSKISSLNGRYRGLGPSLIVCPATVIHQWVKHFHEWWPPFRVALLHQSGTYSGDKVQLINDIYKNKGILVTTYESILKYKEVLTAKKWHYLILDEGHKIRNPTAKTTVALKLFRTPHKLILTGSPMQNNLQELWSLYDFIVPGKLGSLEAFMEYFVAPIVQGGYTNASPTQETTALLIATSLKNLISPFLLRRTKDEVKDDIYLPLKSEQVLFCSLTQEQNELYRGYLLSDHIGGILGRTKTVRASENQGRANILVGIMTLRKICNHPDLYLGEAEDNNTKEDGQMTPETTFGHYKRSGKMIVVAALLKIWKRQGHRMLLFTQTKAMVEIFEDFLTQQEYKYLKMDGTTSVAHRQLIIDKFNKDSSFDVFLLTTRVGGLGVNLTGADRVIIYDPDWNPATDTQARERAWRIGQLRQVTVYRLVSAGTIEEKMYQRQVWKQLLSNKILIDPKTRRFFKTSDLTDLFSLQEHTDSCPETANIFKNSRVELNVSEKHSEPDNSITFSKDKIEAMRTLAHQIAMKMTPSKPKPNTASESANSSKKHLTPTELLNINRKKLVVVEEPVVNKLDDSETNYGFADALAEAANRATSCHSKEKKQEQCDSKSKNEKRKEKSAVKVDNSGEICGEKIECLVKRETAKNKKSKSEPKTNQDDYVLEKLMLKKGVHTALQHDVIVQSGKPQSQNLKIHYEAKLKADMALKALRKSRIKNWRW